MVRPAGTSSAWAFWYSARGDSTLRVIGCLVASTSGETPITEATVWSAEFVQPWALHGAVVNGCPEVTLFLMAAKRSPSRSHRDSENVRPAPVQGRGVSWLLGPAPHRRPDVPQPFPARIGSEKEPGQPQSRQPSSMRCPQIPGKC